MIRLLYAGRVGAICLLAGMLTFGEAGLQAGHPQTAENMRETEAGWTDISVTRMRQKYDELKTAEDECRKKLKAKEAELRAGECGQEEVAKLQEEFRGIQLQKTVLYSRLEEKESGNF